MGSYVHIHLKPGVPEALPYRHTSVPYGYLSRKDHGAHESSNDRTPIYSSYGSSQSADFCEMSSKPPYIFQFRMVVLQFGFHPDKKYEVLYVSQLQPDEV